MLQYGMYFEVAEHFPGVLPVMTRLVQSRRVTEADVIELHAFYTSTTKPPVHVIRSPSFIGESATYQLIPDVSLLDLMIEALFSPTDPADVAIHAQCAYLLV